MLAKSICFIVKKIYFKSSISILVSLDGTTANCDLEDYPAGLVPAALTYHNGEVLACGGYYLEDADRCWSFNGSTWSPLPSSNQRHCRLDSPNVWVNDGWWVTGRLQIRDDKCSNSTTSEIFTGKNWIPGPALPGNIFTKYSCVVNLNTTHTMIIRESSSTATNAWIYNWITKQWTRTDSLIHARAGQGCVSLGDKGILVAGGYNDFNHGIYTAEMYDPYKGTWYTQPNLPPRGIEPTYPFLLNWNDQVLALFTGQKQIYKRDNWHKWRVMEGVRLPSSYGFVYDKAVLVPENWSCNPAQ